MKALDNLIKKQESLNKSTDSLKDSWKAVSSQVFQLDGANWFKKVPMAADEIRGLQDEIKNLTGNIKHLEKGLGNALDQSALSDKLKDKTISYFNEYEKGLSKISKDSADYNILESKAKREMIEQFRADFSELAEFSDAEIENLIKQTSYGIELSDIYDDLSESARNILVTHQEIPDEAKKFKDEIEKSLPTLDDLNKKLADGTKEVFTLSNAFSNFTSNLISKGVGAISKFDQVINDVQKNAGIAMDDNAESFANLTRNVAEYGMSVENAGQMMTAMSEELNTTNFSVLSKATEDLAAVEGATGASLENITGISGQLMRMGKTSEEVKDYFDEASKMAQKFGVSSKRALDAISRNIKKMREMGFVGGEKSLQRMVVTAERLNMNVDEIFDVAKRARTIEGAMEMASELQLAGGSFANINPMDLLAASRKGPEELQKILTQMGGDVGRFNKETGEYEFDPVDVDRLQMVADATGQTLDSVMNGIQKSGLDKQKLEPFSGMLDGLEEADKALLGSSISDMMKWDEEKGAFVLDAESDMAKRMGVDSMEELQAMSASDLKKKIEEDAKNLEEQNKRNQSFQKSLENFWNSLQSVFYIFQPILEVLTTVLQSITSAFTWVMKGIDSLGWFGSVIKWAIPLLLLFGTGFASSVWTFVSKGITSFASNIKKLFTNPASLFGKAGGETGKTSDMMPKAEGPKKGVGEGLKDLSDGLRAMGDAKVYAGIGAVALAGPAFLLFVPALPGLLVMGLIGKMGDSVQSGFEAIAKGLSAFGSEGGVFSGILAVAASSLPLLLFAVALPGLLAIGAIGLMAPFVEAGFRAIATGIGYMGQNMMDVIKGSIAMLVIGAAIIPFMFAASLMGGIDWVNVLAGVGVMMLVMIALIGVGALAMTVGWLILAGAGLLAAAGLAMAVAALGLMAMGEAFTMLQAVDASKILDLSLAMMALGPGLLAFAVAVMVLNFVNFESLNQFGSVISQLGAIEPGNLSLLGSALSVLAPGLLAFGFASMFFANPMTLLGIMMMTWALGDLVGVMTPLAQALSLGAESLNGFADGIQKLSSATGALSDEKLEKLQKISEAMAEASASGNIGAVIAAMEGGGGGAAEHKITVDVKMNGRDLAHTITQDTKILK